MPGSPSEPVASVDLTVLEVPVRLNFTSRTAWLADKVLHGWADCGAALADPGALSPEDQIVLADPADDIDAGQWPSILMVHNERSALTDLASRVTLAGINKRGGELMMLHGCAVARPDTGATAAFVAPSGTGKTTFSRTLAGKWTYVTDETVALHLDRTVVAYPKPLSIIEDGFDAGTKTQTPVTSVGISVAPSTGLRLAALSLLDRQPDHQGVTVTPIETVDALALLAPESSYLAKFDTPLQSLARIINEIGGVQRLTYAEVADLEPYVAEMLS